MDTSSYRNHTKGISYVVLFIVLTVSLFLLMTKSVVADNENYKTVIVRQGDSLWSIAQKYHHDNPKLSKNAFIDWVEEKNGINRNHIEPQQKLLIPVQK